MPTAPPKKKTATPKGATVRVPVLLSADQHKRYLKAAEKAGGMELAPFFRLCAEEKIRRDDLT